MSSYNRLFYHFHSGEPEKPRAIILPEFEAEYVYVLDCREAIELGGIVHAVGGVEDTYIWPPPSRRKLRWRSLLVRSKGNSSHAINHVVKPHYNFYWQNEYGVLSFAEKNLAGIVQYIHDQKQHHAKGTTYPAMEKVDEEN